MIEIRSVPRRIRWSRPIMILASVGIAVGLSLAIMTVLRGGIGWDSPFDLRTGLLFLNVSPGATFDEVLGLIPDQDVSNGTFRFQLAEFVNLLLGGGSPLDSALPSAYLSVGIATALLGASAIIPIVIGPRVITGSRFPGVLAAAFLFTLPLWVGLLGVAWRDVPVAAGMTWFAAGLSVAIYSWSSQRARVFSLLALFVGAFFTVGTRGGAIALIALMLVVTLPATWWPRRGKGHSTLLMNAALVVVSALGALSAAWLHPVARLDMARWFEISVALAREHPNVTLVKVLSLDTLSSEVPWWYVPAYLTAQLPLLLGLSMVVALIALLVGLYRRIRSRSFTSAQVALWPYLVQGLVLPVLLVLSGVNLYDGLRHVLFILPALAILAGLGVYELMNRVSKPWVVAALPVLVMATILMSLFATIRWFPYSYAFINPVAGLVKEPRIWELDYWGLTAREGFDRLREGGAEDVWGLPTANTGAPWGMAEPSPGTALPDGAYVFERWDAALPQDCPQEFVISRDGHVLGRGGLCQGPPNSNG